MNEGDTWSTTYPDEYGTPQWTVVFKCTARFGSVGSIALWFDWTIYEHAAAYEDGRVIYWRKGGGAKHSERETDHIAEAQPLIAGSYRNDHNGERMYWDTSDQVDTYDGETDALLSMLRGVRDEMRAKVTAERDGGEGQ